MRFLEGDFGSVQEIYQELRVTTVYITSLERRKYQQVSFTTANVERTSACRLFRVQITKTFAALN